jgi:hypothetical protein
MVADKSAIVREHFHVFEHFADESNNGFFKKENGLRGQGLGAGTREVSVTSRSSSGRCNVHGEGLRAGVAPSSSVMFLTFRKKMIFGGKG